MAHAAVARLAVPEEHGGFAISGRNEAPSSGVSWLAVLAGAVAAAALWLILLALGTGVGLSSVSPWSNMGASTSAISTGAILWLIVTQNLMLLAAGVHAELQQKSHRIDHGILGEELQCA